MGNNKQPSGQMQDIEINQSGNTTDAGGIIDGGASGG